MKVLVVANSKIGDGRFSHFVNEQLKAIQAEGVEIVKFGMTEKGLLGYLKSAKALRKIIKETNPDCIHAHYGLCGICANLQRMVPVVTTYHGSDIHSKGWNLALSRISIRLSAYNIFVSKKLFDISKAKCSKYTIVPCGIDVNTIQSIPREEALGKLQRHAPFVLFSGSFSNGVKNAPLAQEAMTRVPNIELVELEGYSRQEVNLLMNAASCLLMTSHREGSPQVVKEAMACCTPVVSVDVGDVKDVIGGTEGCYIAKYDANDIAEKIKMALEYKEKTKGRQRIIELGLDNQLLAKRVVSVYEQVINKNN